MLVVATYLLDKEASIYHCRNENVYSPSSKEYFTMCKEYDVTNEVCQLIHLRIYLKNGQKIF